MRASLSGWLEIVSESCEESNGQGVNNRLPRSNIEETDPEQWVVFGRRGVDEMSHMWVGLTDLKQEEFDWLVAERESGPSSDKNESESSNRR